MYFQKGRLTVSIRRKVTPGHPGWIWFVQCPDLICLAAHWSGPATSARRLSAILRVRQSLLDSFLQLGNLHWFLYLMLSYFYDLWHVYLPLEFEFRGNVELEREQWRPRCHLVPPTLCIILYGGWIWANYLENSFEQRATTTNCGVSFIDLYIVFPRNFRIVFLPHTNTIILLEPYFGTIREPGLPVLKPTIIRASKLYFFRLF